MNLSEHNYRSAFIIFLTLIRQSFVDIVLCSASDWNGAQELRHCLQCDFLPSTDLPILALSLLIPTLGL